MRTDTDPTPPHGIPRPSPADLAEAYLVHWRMVTDDTADRDAIDTLDRVLWLLRGACHAWQAGKVGRAMDALDRALDLFRPVGVGAFPEVEPCRYGHLCCSTVPGGACSNEVEPECVKCGETGRRLDEDFTCADCLGLYPEEMGGDDLDEIATNPFGGALDR